MRGPYGFSSRPASCSGSDERREVRLPRAASSSSPTAQTAHSPLRMTKSSVPESPCRTSTSPGQATERTIF